MTPAPNLVVQAPGLDARDAEALAQLVNARSIERLTPCAFRLRAATRSPEAAAFCARRALDHAWVPAGRRFADLGLIAIDMDSTLITIECIDEIGGMLGIKSEIAAITLQAMRGEIDYAESLRQRVVLLAGLALEALDRVYAEKLRLSPGAEPLVGHARKLGIRTLLVSGGFNFFSERLKERLHLDYTLANALEIEAGRLTGRIAGDIVDARAKAARFVELAGSLGVQRGQTLAIGDGANDVAMLAEAGVSVAYHAKPVVRARATHALDYCGLDGVLNLFE